MIIDELKPSTKVKGRFLVKLDEGTILRVTEQEILDFSLHVGQELSFQEAEALENASKSSGLKTKAYNAISRKSMSRRDLEKKLAQWEGSPEEIAQICDRFEELNLINDENYAKLLAGHYQRKGYGPRRIQQEFYQHGVPREYWEDALAELEEEDHEKAIDHFFQQKCKGQAPDPKQLKKVSDALARRGFSWSEIRAGALRYDETMAELWAE